MNAKYKSMHVPPQYQDVFDIGKYSYADGGSPNIVLCQEMPHARLSIGSFVSIGPRCTIYLGSEHKPEFISTFPFSRFFDDVPIIECVKTKGDVIIGSDVWIGADATILSGVTIGHGAVIGNHAVVAKNVAPYAVVVGNPIQVVRKRFLDWQIAKLLEIKWWEWGDEKISRSVALLLSEDIEEFLKVN